MPKSLPKSLRNTRPCTWMLAATLVFTALAAASPAHAQDVKSRGERACKSDASRFCRQVLDQGDDAILSCLQTSQAKISDGCRRFLREQGHLQ